MSHRYLLVERADLTDGARLVAAAARWLGDYDREEVIRLFREYEFRSLVERLPDLEGEDAPAPGDLLKAADRSGPVPAAQVAGRKKTPPAGGGSGLQLSLDFGAVAGSSAEVAEGGSEATTQGLDPVALTLRQDAAASQRCS